MKTLRIDFFRVAAACVVFFLAGPSWGQVPEQRLKSFGFPGASGSSPVGLLVGADGALYGTTSLGGLGAAGTVFSVSPDGGGYTVLHAFTTNSIEGQNPLAGLVQGRDGMLYGTTSGGGSNHAGTVFKLADDGTAYSVLYHFGSFDQDGSLPKAALVQGTDGALYGTTYSGGTNGFGMVFKIGTGGTAYTILHSFASGAGDGANPQTALAQGPDGLLYGTTFGGGTVFKLGANGEGYTQIHTFGSDIYGVNPSGLAQGGDGAWYGTTELGGTNGFGMVFKLGADGSGYAVLHHFSGTLGDGANPRAPLIRGAEGALYGTTSGGGSLQKEGTVFRLNGDGTGYRVIRRFTVITSVLSDYSTDGQDPGLLTQAADGRLYGATFYGGTTGQGGNGQGAGTIFTLNTDGGQYSVIYDFSNSGGDGANPRAALMLGRDGAFYGTTESGGDGGAGTVFKLDSHGTGYDILHSFGHDSIDGLAPQSALIQGRDGMLYGMASRGGFGGSGIAFKVNPDGGDYTQLHSFGAMGLTEGSSPAAPLLQGGDGELYGTTPDGGYESDFGGFGTVFKLNTNGTAYSILYLFNTNGLDGQKPQGGLIQGRDGALYGTTYGGSSYDGFGLTYGTVFKLLTNGTAYQVLHTFTNNGLDGINPSAALVQGSDGALYGTTKYGGANPGLSGGGSGIVFKLNPNGSGYQVLYNFGNNSSDGQNPAAPLVQGGDGALYGTTVSDGANTNPNADGYGIVFKVNTNGTGYTVLHSFGATSGDGWMPQGGLVEGAEGAFYGATVFGGDLGNGTVFRLGTNPLQFTSFSRLPDKTILLSLSGAANTTCRIDAAANLGNWVALTNIPNRTGVVHFIDSSAPQHPRRFYRAVQAP